MVAAHKLDLKSLSDEKVCVEFRKNVVQGTIREQVFWSNGYRNITSLCLITRKLVRIDKVLSMDVFEIINKRNLQLDLIVSYNSSFDAIVALDIRSNLDN